MKGWVYTTENYQRLLDGLHSDYDDSTVKKLLRNINMLMNHNCIVGNIIPLDENYCAKLWRGRTLQAQRRRNLRKGLRDLETYGRVVNFDERTGRLV